MGARPSRIALAVLPPYHHVGQNQVKAHDITRRLAQFTIDKFRRRALIGLPGHGQETPD
jgi:hypothetical protein